MPDNIVSRPYHPKMACEACCFGRGEHAEWCRPNWMWLPHDPMHPDMKCDYLEIVKPKGKHRAKHETK